MALAKRQTIIAAGSCGLYAKPRGRCVFPIGNNGQQPKEEHHVKGDLHARLAENIRANFLCVNPLGTIFIKNYFAWQFTMVLKNYIFRAIVLIVLFSSCNSITPASFWEVYGEGFIIKKTIEQRPNGIRTAIYWRANSTNTFNICDMQGFIKRNGWTLIDSTVFDEDQTNKWTYNNMPVFPLTNTGAYDTVSQHTELGYFPRWFGGQLKVYKFKTGSTANNGFVVISSDKNQMAVYHFWRP